MKVEVICPARSCSQTFREPITLQVYLETKLGHSARGEEEQRDFEAKALAGIEPRRRRNLSRDDDNDGDFCFRSVDWQPLPPLRHGSNIKDPAVCRVMWLSESHKARGRRHL